MAGSIAYDAGGHAVVAGNLRVGFGVLTAADGAGEAVPTGMKTVFGFNVVPKSCATLANVQQFSKSAGNITPASCSSGDDFFVTVWGR